MTDAHLNIIDFEYRDPMAKGASTGVSWKLMVTTQDEGHMSNLQVLIFHFYEYSLSSFYSQAAPSPTYGGCW